jgi:hypothetical protein
MDQKQLELVARCMIARMTAVELKIFCLLQFAQLKILKKPAQNEDCYVFRKGMQVFELDADRFAFVISRLDYLEEDPTVFNPPVIKGFVSPNKELYGVRTDQWFVADSMYAAFCKTRDDRFLNRLLATLYVRKAEKWNPDMNMTAAAAKFESVPLYRKYVAFMWYTAVKTWLIDKYFYVFSGSESSQTPADELLMGLLSSVNEGNVANNAIIKATEVHEVLYDLNRKIELSKTR